MWTLVQQRPKTMFSVLVLSISSIYASKIYFSTEKANMCVKNTEFYTPEQLIDEVICPNAAYRHIILDKVCFELFQSLDNQSFWKFCNRNFQNCKKGNCPPCNSKHIFLRQPKYGLVPLESCESKVAYSGRLPADEVCSYLASTDPETVVNSTCPLKISPLSKYFFN